MGYAARKSRLLWLGWMITFEGQPRWIRAMLRVVWFWRRDPNHSQITKKAKECGVWPRPRKLT